MNNHIFFHLIIHQKAKAKHRTHAGDIVTSDETVKFFFDKYRTEFNKCKYHNRLERMKRS